MSDKNLARRTKVRIYIDGANISDDVNPYFISLSYTDNETDETDDLQLVFHDRDNIWLDKWLDTTVQAAAASEYPEGVGKPYTVTVNSSLNVRSGAGTGNSILGSLSNGAVIYVSKIENGWAETVYSGKTAYVSAQYLKEGGEGASGGSAQAKGLRMQAVIIRENWNADGEDAVLDCGEFELDSISEKGPPDVVTLKGTSLPYRSTIRGAAKSKAWEGYTLSKIAAQVAGANGMGLSYHADADPSFARCEQVEQSDITFLQDLCKKSGIALKATSNLLVLFDVVKFEAENTVRTITKGDKSYLSYDLSTGKNDTEYSACHVQYTNPQTGKKFEFTHKMEDADESKEDYRVLEVTQKVESNEQAQALAKKLLRLHNKFAYTISLTLPGDTSLLAGLTIQVCKFGMFSGKYAIKQAQHTVSSSGYVTKVMLRKIVEGG